MTDVVAPLRSDAALFLDFDGTLAPIQDDPDEVRLPHNGAGVLAEICARLSGALAIISGRDIHDLSARVPSDLWRIGAHGLDVCAPGEPPSSQALEAPQGLRTDLQTLIDKVPGARLETKGAVLALHYRAAPDAGASIESAAAAIIENADGYVMQHGKMVIEAKPATANKGAALRAMMNSPSFAGRAPVMVGDDVTDEDAMVEALRMGGYAVKVGEGPTVAKSRLGDPGAVWRWLSTSVGV